jgi:DNA-binding IscR family transcriptional regulator
MRMSEGVEWTVHCCTVLAMLPAGECLSGARLAEYHAVPAPYLAKHLQALTRAGVLESVSGP